MDYFRKVESGLVTFFGKLPKLSEGTKELLVNFWPWLALIGGLFQLFAAWSLYVWARSANEIIQYADQLNRYGADIGVARWDVWVGLAFITLIVDAVVLLVAFPKLQARLKSGWNLMLISGFLSFMYALMALMLRYRGSLWEDVWSLIVALFVFYLLFQVRSYYRVRVSK